MAEGSLSSGQRQGQARAGPEEVPAAPRPPFPLPWGHLTRRRYQVNIRSSLANPFLDLKLWSCVWCWPVVNTENKFKQFPMKYLFRQGTASSHCPLSNRLAENSVEILTRRYEKRARSQALTHTWPCRPALLCQWSQGQHLLTFWSPESQDQGADTVRNRS